MQDEWGRKPDKRAVDKDEADKEKMMITVTSLDLI